MATRHVSTAGSSPGGPPKGGRRHRKLSNYLLDRSFQLKYVGMILGLSLLISIALGVFLVDQMRENSRMLQLDAELDPVFQEQLAQADAHQVAVLVGALLLFNLILAFGAVVVTHRMAGPIFVFRRYLGMLAEGRIPQMRALRRGDEFGDVLEQMRSTVQFIERGLEEDLEVAARIRAALAADGGPDLDAARAELDRFEARRRESLGIETSS